MKEVFHNPLTVKILKTTSSVVLPKRKTEGAAAWDIYSPGNYRLEPETITTIPSGFRLEIPEGYYVSIIPRSSMGMNGIFISNSPGTIDSDYRGHIHMIFYNANEKAYNIDEGDRVAQMMLHKCIDFDFEEVDSLSNTERNDGGLGSTGR